MTSKDLRKAMLDLMDVLSGEIIRTEVTARELMHAAADPFPLGAMTIASGAYIRFTS